MIEIHRSFFLPPMREEFTIRQKKLKIPASLESALQNTMLLGKRKLWHAKEWFV